MPLLETLQFFVSIRIAPNEETKLTIHISEFSIMLSTLSLATNNCGYTSDDTIRASAYSHSKEQFKLLLFISLGYASIRNLKMPFVLSAHHTMESSFHFYDMMATECSLQKQVPPWILYLKYNKQLSTFQEVGTFVGALMPEEPIAQITKTFIKSFLFQNYISMDTLKMSFFQP